MFFRISFVSDISEEPCYFALIIWFSLFHLFQIAGKNHPSKYSSWWRHFGGDVLKTSWRCLQCNIFCLIRSWKCLEDVLRSDLEDVLKKFLEDVLEVRLEDVLKTSWKTKNCCAEDVLKTSWKTRNVCWDTTMQLNPFRYVLKVSIVFSCYLIRH